MLRNIATCVTIMKTLMLRNESHNQHECNCSMMLNKLVSFIAKVNKFVKSGLKYVCS